MKTCKTCEKNKSVAHRIVKTFFDVLSILALLMFVTASFFTTGIYFVAYAYHGKNPIIGILVVLHMVIAMFFSYLYYKQFEKNA